MIRAEDVYAATEGGKAVILHFYPQSAAGFTGRRNFSIRGDGDRHPSCTVFNKSGRWWLQDKGGDDNKAYDAISLVRKEMGLSYPQAIDWIAATFAPSLAGAQAGAPAPDAPRPDIQEAPPQDAITVQPRKGGRFTAAELALLGLDITQEVCDMFSLKPVDSYVTRRNAKGKSWRVSSNASYPIYYYDYGCYGKLYQPLGDVRFMWVGDKPDGLISGERDFMDMYRRAQESPVNPFVVPPDPEDGSEGQDLQWKDLIICSGPSDALNVRRAGWHVCWLNSETADLTEREVETLRKIAKRLYILYDIDETGIESAHRIAMRYLDISVIRLPDDLRERRTPRGKPCKDAKDFFMYYRKPELGSVDRVFDGLVRLSGGLMFWTERHDKMGQLSGYDINNAQLYDFLSASGFHTMDDGLGGSTYCRIRDNVVETIPPQQIEARCVRYLQDYITTHPQYYRQALANAIFRSPQLREASLKNLRTAHPDLRAYSAEADWFFFRNCIVRVSKDGVAKVSPSACPCMVLQDRIIQHDFTPLEPLFEVEWSRDYMSGRSAMLRLPPGSPERRAAQKKLDAMDGKRKYTLKLRDTEFDFLRFVYNTGRVHWRKEEEGYPLTEAERAEHDLNFISKVAMLGYLLSKHKDAAKAYGVYAIETEQGAEGEHRGGTGKSLLLRSVEQLRDQVYIDGQAVKPDKMDFILAQVRKGVTDNVYVDDLNSRVDLHRFMNWITGKMEVNPKNRDQFTLDYYESPKVSFSSNHAIRNFDSSLRRRTWFAAFSNYYHPEDIEEGLVYRSPETEFGRTLLQDYGEDDWNRFYNFMFGCIVVWKRFGVRIQPSMEQIERRNLQKSMTEEFMWWAEDWFTESRLDRLVDKDAAFAEYRATLPKAAADMIRPQTFKARLQMFCRYKDWTFNPRCLLLTDTERARNDIRRKVNYEDRYYFYIDTTGEENLPVADILGTAAATQGGAGGAGGDAPPDDGGDLPIFGE